MRRPSRLVLGLLVAAALGAALVGWLVWRAQGLPTYVPPGVRHEVPPIGEEVRIAALGDWGAATREQAEVARAIDRTAGELGGLHAGIFLGDNFYNRGVQSVNDPLFEQVFEQVYDTPWLGRLPWYPVLGNHDYDGNPKAQIAYTARSKGRWILPSEYYRVDLPDPAHPLVTLLGLDTNEKFSHFEQESAWLEKELSSLETAPQIVLAFGHNPIVSYCTKPNRIEPQMARWFRPVMERHPTVDLYLAGHAHVMEMIEVGGLPLAVVGTGGKRLYEVEGGPGSSFHAATFGFALLRVRPGHLQVEFRDRDARVLYTWEHDREVHEPR